MFAEYGRGGGQVVSDLTFYSNNPSSNPGRVAFTNAHRPSSQPPA